MFLDILLLVLLVQPSIQDISHCEEASENLEELENIISELNLDSQQVVQEILIEEETVPRDFFPFFAPGISKGLAPDTSKGSGRIVGGIPAAKDDHPWAVSLRQTKSCLHFCGGSLISPRWVVTVAHCIWKSLPWNTFVVAGGRSSNSRDMGDQAVIAEDIYTHPDYNWCNKNYWNDIGLIKLSTDIKVVNVFISLPGPTALLQPLSGTVEVVGFGRVEFKGPGALRLNKVFLPVLSSFLCTKLMQKSKPLMFCAGEEGRDSCQGDSGSGAVQGGTLVGLVSHGAGCGTQPGVYTDVRHYASWIQLLVEEKKEEEEEKEREEKNKDPKRKRQNDIKKLIFRLLQCHGLSTKFT